jgi:hypothetical protein
MTPNHRLTKPSNRWFDARLFVCFGLLLFVFYRGTLDDYFYHDDFVFLERSWIRIPSDLGRLFSVELATYGLQEQNHSYRPISTNVYFGVLQLAVGPTPFYFHLSNLALLVGNSVLLCRLLVLLDVHPVVSVACAAVYAASLVNFDSQLWISVCQELLFQLFALLAILLFAQSEERGRVVSHIVSVSAYVLALLSKEMAVTVPALLLLYLVIALGKRPWPAVRALVPFGLAAGGYLLWRSVYFDLPREGPYALSVGAFLLSHLMRYLLWSMEAIFLSRRPEIAVLVAALGMAALSVSTTAQRRVCAFGVSWFLVALLPVLFMPNHIYRYYLAVPMVGVMLVLGALTDAVVARIGSRRRATAVLACIVAVFCFFSYGRFSKEAAARAKVTAAFAEIVRSIKFYEPTPQDGTEFLFVFPETNWGSLLLKGDGAVVRMIYRNPTLKARELKMGELHQIARRGGERYLVFEWTRERGLIKLR